MKEMKEKRALRKVAPLVKWKAPDEKPVLPRRRKSLRRWAFGCGGAFTGGCLLPLLLMVGITAATGDRGGPLFWGIIWIPLAVVGLLTGFAAYEIKMIGKDNDS